MFRTAVIIGISTYAGIKFGGKLRDMAATTLKPAAGSALETVLNEGAPVAVGMGVGLGLHHLWK